jgi:hypothetical protein
MPLRPRDWRARRVHAGANGILAARSPVSVDGNPKPQHVRVVDERFHFREAVLLAGHGVGFREYTAGAAEFDHLGSYLRSLHDRPNLIGPVRRLRARYGDRRRKFRGVALACGCSDRTSNGSRRARASCRRPIWRHRRSWGTHIADGGKSRLESFPGVGDGDHRPETFRELEAPITTVVRIGGKMCMHVDQAREQRPRTSSPCPSYDRRCKGARLL